MTTRSVVCTAAGAALPPGLPSVTEVLGRVAGENFKVASALLPKAARAHLVSFYGFARFVDQIGDAYAGDRLAALDWLQAETAAALADPGDPAGRHPLVAGAARSVRILRLDPDPLFRLIEANRRDQTVASYPTIAALVEYCSYSADPVGRLVLGAFGHPGASGEVGADPARALAWSDAICTGLQLVEHWQDVVEDARAGRVYLPEEDLDRFGVDRPELVGPGPASTGFRSLMVFEVARARTWLDRGRPLISALSGRPRVAVAGFHAGGHAALDAIAARNFDVTGAAGAPRPTRLVVARHMLRTLARDGRP